ncbi:phosphotransferase enzyme family protein [Georgenia alba]|uniref:Phosphotransferase enzyme family protein n=1 Tax=Georgenia alba TaxID=2233858 RepID=A0ABW2QBR1_9MICO
MSDLAALLRHHWGMAGAAVGRLGGGMNSETWTVEHDGARYVAKSVPAHDRDGLVRGCAVAAALAEAGLVTGRPVPTVDGGFVPPETATALLEHVPGRELAGATEWEQREIAHTLGRVHRVGGPTVGRGTSGFFTWLTPQAPGVGDRPWLARAVRAVRAETDQAVLTWSVLHTDPAPEAFRRDPATGVTGLIDWTGAQRGPVLYDVASAVMYLGGPDRAASFLESYRELGLLGTDEWRRLDDLRRFRWIVQAVYFTGRLVSNDLTGVSDQADNERGLQDARRGLAELGVESTGDV